jgi:hypothetical protein
MTFGIVSRMRRVILVLLVMCSIAHADDRKSVKTAQWLSGGGVAVSSVLALGGFFLHDQSQAFNAPLLWSGIATSIVTPSLGEWYAGEWMTIGMAVRVGGAGLATYALTKQQKEVVCELSTSAAGTKCKELNATAIVLLGIAAIAFVGGAAYDVGDAEDSVGRYNQRHGYYVAPTPMVGPQGLAPGLTVGGYF